VQTSEIERWTELRAAMIRTRPDAFTRDEWAYLISFLDAGHLQGIVHDTFAPNVMARPRGSVVVWLPNNVTLLGPLTLILLTLTGNRIFMKEGSRADALTLAFADFVRANGGAALLERAEIVRAERNDPAVLERTTHADVVIVFGFDEAVAAAAQHVRPGATLIPFSDRRSEAWLAGSPADGVLVDLIKVFAVYGQAGCTSPARVVVLDGSAEEIRDRIVRLWPERLRNREPHVASSNILAAQLAAAAGWDAALVAANSAVIAAGAATLEIPQAGLFLPIVALPVADAIASLPANIQTVGHNVDADMALQWLAGTAVKRIVPIAAMHHFGPVWDGREWFRECFEWVEVTPRDSRRTAAP
jgi:Acyl-CoA reductase (LuxC)